MTTVSTSKLDDAIKQFKSTFAANPDLFSLGQFYVSLETENALVADIASDLRNEVPKSDADAMIAALRNFFNTTPTPDITLDAAKRALAPWAQYAALDSVWARFPSGPPSSADAAYASKYFNLIWTNNPNIAGPPILSPTIGRAQAAFQLEKNKCFIVARGFANKLLTANKVTSLDKKLAISAGTIASAVAQDEPASGDPAQPERKQTIIYKDQAALKNTVSGMKAAIDAGAAIQCGVVSGVRQNTNLFTQPEHYVLAFAYDSVEGMDTFLFWDPDAAVSHITSTSWGVGFGCLFSTDGRLSTAVSVEDLQAVDTDGNSKTNGDHLNDLATNAPKASGSAERRHRYQVYYVQTLPL